MLKSELTDLNERCCCQCIDNIIYPSAFQTSHSTKTSAESGIADEIINVRISDWSALTGPISFPGQTTKRGYLL